MARDGFRLARGVAVGLGYFALFLIYAPIFGLVVLSFSQLPLSGIPWPLTLEWYRQLFSGEPRWLAPSGLSIWIAVIVAILSTATATLVGRALPTLRRPSALLWLFLVVLFLPGLVVGLAVLLFYRAMLGIATGLWSIVLAHFVWAFPFSLLCVLLVTIRFDARLLDAARDLGAGSWRRFVDIELPLLQPGISASLFFAFLLSFNELPRTIYVHGARSTLPYFLWTESAAHSTQVALIYALSSLIMLGSVALTVAAFALLMGAGNNAKQGGIAHEADGVQQ
jgi:ABC-type spermidine/putrescine transport system permease subunit II